MEMTLDKATIKAIAQQTADILERRMRKHEAPEYITCKEAATLRGIKPQRMREIADQFPHIKLVNGEKQGRLMFLREGIINSLQ